MDCGKAVEQKILNRDEIKLLAMITMLLNHIANLFIEPGTPLHTALIDIGYFTMPVMCWFLAEGYHYTRSKKRYGLRLAVFAAISEIPFCLAFSELFTGEKYISFCGFNMIFTLLLCFCILLVQEYIYDSVLRMALIVFLFLISMASDWGITAPALTMLFSWSRSDTLKTKKAFLIGTGLMILTEFHPETSPGDFLSGLISACFSAFGIILAGLVILYLYNGKRAEKGRTFFKWFFYLFYPVHLLILGMIRIIML